MAAVLQEIKTDELRNDEFQATVRDLLAQLGDLSTRVATLEKLATAGTTQAV